MSSEVSTAMIGLAASPFVLVAYWLYNQDTTKINTSAWLIFLSCDLLDLFSYNTMTGGWVKSIIPAELTIGSAYTCIRAFRLKLFALPEGVEWVVLALSAGITGLWWALATGRVLVPWLPLSPAAVANVCYQAPSMLGFIALYRGQLIGKEIERPWPWVWWSAAYVLFFVSATYDRHGLEELVYPLVGVINHLGVVAIALALYKPQLRRNRIN